LAQAVSAAKAVGINSPVMNTLRFVCNAIGELQDKIADLDKACHHHSEGDELSHARYARDVIFPAMGELRKAGDRLENLVADDLWPLPTYREMLFLSR